MSPFDFLLVGLAAWRVSSLVTHENGPFRVFAYVRHIMGVDRPGELTGLAELFSCVWCMSVWLSGFLLLLLILGDAGRYILAVPALSTVAIFLEAQIRKP